MCIHTARVCVHLGRPLRIKRGGLVYTHTLTIDAHTEDLCIHKPLYRQSPEKVHIYTKFALLYTKSMNIYTNSRYMGFVVHKLNDQKAQVHKKPKIHKNCSCVYNSELESDPIALTLIPPLFYGSLPGA